MSSWFRWEHNPSRKFFGIELAKYWGYELKLHTRYPSKAFGATEKTVLRTAISELPDTSLQLLQYRILEVLGPPPKELIIKSFLLQAKKEKVSQSNRIMVDAECFNRITGLSILGMDTRGIKNEFKAMFFPPNYSLEHIERFRYHFWNVNPNEGWDHKSNEMLKHIILSDPDLTEGFKHLLEGALSDKKNRRDMAQHYNLSLSPADRTREYLRVGDNAILLQTQLLEREDLKGADLMASIISKTINSGAKLGITPPTTRSEINPNLLDK
ncbi:MAG: hypothetical protein K9N35_01325 [Candidatus Marinimicrobia bacterium]|nr:hypothetical protein [Candidatus Neomarinimicrobiota bacterium]